MKNISLILLLCVQSLWVQAQTLELKQWRMMSVLDVKAADAHVSTPLCEVGQWQAVTVPTTVLNAMVKNGVYPDPRFSLNNYQIPDVSDEFNERMGLAKYNHRKDGRNPWQDPYWYRTEVKLPKTYKGKKVWLTLHGINYRADVWVNGHLVAIKTRWWVCSDVLNWTLLLMPKLAPQTVWP